MICDCGFLILVISSQFSDIDFETLNPPSGGMRFRPMDAFSYIKVPSGRHKRSF
jgi:hypothetical protein